MPKYLIKEIKQSSKEIMDQEMDMNDINNSYEQNISPDENPLTSSEPNEPAPIVPAGF
jgi:hypothetical protein